MNEEEKHILKFVTETTYDAETTHPVFQQTTLNGLRHAPPDGSPSQIKFDTQGRPEHLTWHEYDVQHRIGEPSYVHLNIESNLRIETFFEHGAPISPARGPYKIFKDIETGDIQEQFWDDDAAITPERKVHSNGDIALKP